jgi:hypothetical protein
MRQGQGVPLTHRLQADKITWDKAAVILDWKKDGETNAYAAACSPLTSRPSSSHPRQLLLPHAPGPAPVPPREPAVWQSSAVPIACPPPGRTGQGLRRDDDLAQAPGHRQHNKLLISSWRATRAPRSWKALVLVQLHVLQYVDNAQTGVVKARMKANNRSPCCLTSRLKR